MCSYLEQLPKKELLRIVRSNDGSVSIDLTGRKMAGCLFKEVFRGFKTSP